MVYIDTGTMITEWDDGKAICEEILKSDANYRAVVHMMVHMTVVYGFDGWLINIENKIEVSSCTQPSTCLICIKKRDPSD